MTDPNFTADSGLLPQFAPILRYFRYTHLPENLAAVSKPFYDLAHDIDHTLPGGPEKSVALRKLLEAKDAAVRAALDVE
mgnify:CR=1 FL=1